MKKYHLALLFIICNTGLINAQSISGALINELGRPVQEASIHNKNTDVHTHSDQEGKFLLDNVHIGDTIMISHISYESIDIVITEIAPLSPIMLFTQVVNLDGIVISPQSDILSLMTDIDIQAQPINSSQDILRKVPGIFIGQHAGGGKAEQIFLRGFDIDHGTDIQLTMDGLPVNMVSHAHGQGYADLHFVIPEIVEKIDFAKGPYYADKGNFNTAGYVDFNTKRKLDNSTIKLEMGQFNTRRLLGMYDMISDDRTDAYVAAEYMVSDGPFDSPQNLNRINLLAKYSSMRSASERIGMTASHFSSTWDASGQVPERAIADGSISRYGAIDNTEGGNTSRTNVMVDHQKFLDKKTSIKSLAYWSNYDFELYSNFTFFLDDPINGDQIKQKESRNIVGLKSDLTREISSENLKGSWQAGLSLRSDQSSDNELSKTRNRSETLSPIQRGDIHETNWSAYVGANLVSGDWEISPSMRLDYFHFQYQDALTALYDPQSLGSSILSPKVRIKYNGSDKMQLYLNAGEGFHSNDTRVVIPQDGVETLPAAYGYDAGFIWKPTSSMLINTAYWYLYLDQEFVYVGDAGIVEPSGKTRRQGIELSYRYQPRPWLYYHLDANYTHARSIDEPSDANLIPLAPDFTLVSGISINPRQGFQGGIYVRHLGDRPANETNDIVAHGYTVTDLDLGYKWKKTLFKIQIQNLFDVDWNETQFATESRLMNESEPVEEIHFTPGTPFFLKASIQYSF